MLDDLVVAFLGTATVNKNVARAEASDSICTYVSPKFLNLSITALFWEILTFADVSEPDILQGTSPLAMNSLELPSTDNDIAQGSTVLKNEDGVLASGVFVRVAVTSAVILSVAQVNRAGDGAGLGERDDGAHAGRDVQGLSHNGARHEGGGDNLLKKHDERLLRKISAL